MRNKMRKGKSYKWKKRGDNWNYEIKWIEKFQAQLNEKNSRKKKKIPTFFFFENSNWEAKRMFMFLWNNCYFQVRFVSNIPTTTLNSLPVTHVSVRMIMVLTLREQMVK